MNAKLLLLIGAVLGLLLLATLDFGTDSLELEVPCQLVDSGRFVLESNGIRILEEAYTLEFDPVDGYLLNSQGTIVTDGQTVTLAQQTQYDRNFLPINYQLAADTPSGALIISAQMGLLGLEMELRVGLSVQNAQVEDVENIAVLDNNLIGQFAVMLLAIRTEALDRNFTAAIPQALLSLPARVEGPNTVTFYSGETKFEGKQFDLHLGDTVISLIEYEGHLVGLTNRNQGTIGYDLNFFPSGIQLELEEAQHDVVGEAIERDVAFASGDLSLAGTLRLPLTDDDAYTAVLFIHGSGPVNRDGNAVDLETGNIVMEVDVYRQLAAALSDAGIASFRFDKRGVGDSEGTSALASRFDLLADAQAAIEVLRVQPEIDPDRIILVGHSEGAYLAPVLAVENEDLAGVVLLAGAAQPLDAITRLQVESLLQQQGIVGTALEAALVQQDQYIAFVESSQGEWSDYTTSELQTEITWLNDAAAAQLKATPLALSWLREHYLAEPAEVIVQLQDPVLIISGEKDLQVPSSEAALLSELLETAGNSDVTVYVFPDLNHLLRYHPEEPNLTYRHVNEPVDPRVTEAVQEWIVNHFGT